MIVVEAKGELEFGMDVEDTTSWMISRNRFIDMLKTGTTTFWIFAREGEWNRLEKENPFLKENVVKREHGVVLVKANR